MRIGAILPLLAIGFLTTHSAAAGESDTLRAAYYRAREPLVSKYPEGHDAPGLGDALDRAWSAAANWTAGYLGEHPDATAGQLADAVVALDPPCAPAGKHCSGDYHLSASAVRMSATAFAVAANYEKSGTFFVVARARDGGFRAKWNIKDVARRHYRARDEIGYWSWTGSAWGDGPPIGKVGPLPPAASGHPRFSVDAVAAAEAGGTYRSQFSIWEWDGVQARPLFIESYQVTFDTEPVTIKDDVVSIPTKGMYKSFFTCGSCPEPHVLRRLRVTPDGVHDLGKTDAEPEVRCVDELWDRLIHSRPAGRLATSAVVAALRPVVAEIKRDAGHDLQRSLGMLEESKVEDEGGRRFLLIGADNLDNEQLRFEIGARAGGTCLLRVQILKGRRQEAEGRRGRRKQ